MSEGGGYARERGNVWGEVVPCVCHHVCITAHSSRAKPVVGRNKRRLSDRRLEGVSNKENSNRLGSIVSRVNRVSTRIDGMAPARERRCR